MRLARSGVRVDVMRGVKGVKMTWIRVMVRMRDGKHVRASARAMVSSEVPGAPRLSVK